MAFIAFFRFEKNLAVLTSEQGYIVHLIFVSIPRKMNKNTNILINDFFSLFFKFLNFYKNLPVCSRSHLFPTKFALTTAVVIERVIQAMNGNRYIELIDQQ